VRLGSFVILLLMFGKAAFAIDSAAAFDDPALQTRYDALTHQLRCLVCQNETIADSNASLAADLRRELREQIAAGRSDAEILKFMTDRYGDFVLYKPPLEPRTWLLWAAPGLLLLIGVVVAGTVVLRRARFDDGRSLDAEEDGT
jgi:cytochrome c-type biogenesis protein CcmH